MDIALFLNGAAADSREADLIAGEVALRLGPLESHEFDVNVIDTSDTVFAFRVIREGCHFRLTIYTGPGLWNRSRAGLHIRQGTQCQDHCG